MSRPRKLAVIHAEDAFQAIYYFETADPRSEEEMQYFLLAVKALQMAILEEENREKRNEYNKNRRIVNPEVAEHYRNYQREYRARYRAEGREKKKKGTAETE